MESPVMTIKEAAEYLKVSTAIVYNLVQSKEFPAVKVKGSWRVIRKDLDTWLTKQFEEKAESF